MDISELIQDECFSPILIADALRTHKSEIAFTLGLSLDSVSRKTRIRSKKTQKRLREMIEILTRVEAEIGSLLGAYAWFRSQPLPSFGGVTADYLVRKGEAAAVHSYLDRIRNGGYA